MYSSFQSDFGETPPVKGRPRMRVTLPGTVRSTNGANGIPAMNGSGERKGTFTKVFRWRLPHGQTTLPKSVELAGSFTGWERVPMNRDKERDVWVVTVPHIPVNRTHHYMLLVDGKPVRDENADGLAHPRGPEEEKYQLSTPRGGRVFLLYGQTK
jgi:hypothetical protein